MKYIIGQENGIVKEQDFHNSIFRDQYEKALRLIDTYLNVSENLEETDTLNIIGFCGDRGEGKTSCMYNVKRILEELSSSANLFPADKNFGKRFATSLELKNLSDYKFFCMDIIDPSYFDYSHNILEILLGKLYSIYSEAITDKNFQFDRSDSQTLLKKFEKVKRSIFNLHKKEEAVYSELTEIRMLASAVELKELMRSLIRSFLKLTSTDKLVISIDDIDLNVNGAFEMCEQIRKYLSLPECIILIAVRPKQLEDVVASEFFEEMGNNLAFYNKQYYTEMAQRYIAKLLPVSSRIPMRRVYDYCDDCLKIYPAFTGNSSKEPIPLYDFKSIKEGVVNLIFMKTRYLFYNSRGGISLIIPNNLRQLNALLGLLTKMEDLTGNDDENIDILRRNGNLFKEYFYNIWTDSLKPKNKEQILQWVYETAYNVLNKNIIQWLVSNFKKELERKYQTYDIEDRIGSSVKIRNLLSKITSDSNFSYNVSIGDLFFILGLLEFDVLSPDQERMIFFIKSFYSILLFEEYDVETYLLDKDDDDEESLIKIEIDESEEFDSIKSRIYDSDGSFERSTWLQRLIGGSYFTFFPGELLPTDQSGEFHYDSRVINGFIRPTFTPEEDVCYTLRDLLVKCKSIISNYDKEKQRLEELTESNSPSDQEERLETDLKLRIWELNFCMAEFFMLTVSRPIRRKEISAFYNGQDSFRSVSTPAYFIDFSQMTGYYVFDALAPFSNLLNPRGCYERYEDMAEGLFDFAVSHDFSLMSKILGQVRLSRPHIKGDSLGKKLHRLMSDVVIRNGEVLDAMRSNIRSYKDNKNRVYGIRKILSLYEAISDSHMSTHPYHGKEHHKIKFEFLKPLQEFLLMMTKFDDQFEIKKTFFHIFDFVEDEIFSKTENENPLWNRLENKLLLIFGNGKIGKSQKVYDILKKEFPEELANLTPGDFLKATEGKNYIIYDVDKILEFLFIPKEKARLDLWIDILGIANPD